MHRSWIISLIALLCISILLIINLSYGNIEANSWVTRTSMPPDSYGGQAVGVNGKIYVIGGFYGGLIYSANNVYDPSTDNWTALTPTPEGVITNSLVAYQNKIYSIGANTTEVYDISTDSWKAKTPMPTGTTGSGNIVNGEIYVISGYNSANQQISINEVYNIANDSWTTKTSIPIPVSVYASTVCDGKIYIIGGQNPSLGSSSMNVDFTQIYDPSTDTWSMGAPMLTHVLAPTAGATTGVMAPARIYLFGGFSSDTNFQSVDYHTTNLTQVYDPKNNTWTYGAQMLSPRTDFAVANVNDKFYVLGGSNVGLGAPYVLNNEEYIPFDYNFPQQPNSTPPKSPTVPELSWLVILPLLLSLFAVAVVLRHRKSVDGIRMRS